MPRSRMIHPEFYNSPSLGSCSRNARLLFPAMWMYSDDLGHCRSEPAYWKAIAFPLDMDISPNEVATMLAELEAAHCIRPYEDGDRLFYAVPRWDLWQKIKKPSEWRIEGHEREERAEASRHKKPTSGVVVPHQYPTSGVEELPQPEPEPEPEVEALGFTASKEETESVKPLSRSRKKRASATRSEKPKREAAPLGECAWCARPRKEDAGVHYLLQRMHDTYREKFGTCLVLTPAKDGSLLKQIGTSGHDEAEIILVWQHYLDSVDEFAARNGYTVGHFKSVFNGVKLALDNGRLHGARGSPQRGAAEKPFPFDPKQQAMMDRMHEERRSNGG